MKEKMLIIQWNILHNDKYFSHIQTQQSFQKITHMNLKNFFIENWRALYSPVVNSLTLMYITCYGLTLGS